MSEKDILALAIIVVLAIIIPIVINILLYKKCQNLYIENRMLRRTIEAQSKLDELSWSAQQAMVNEAFRASGNRNYKAN